MLLVVVVAVGGFVGSAARYAVSLWVVGPGDWPWSTLVVNLAGSFVLGVLLEIIARRGPESRAAERVRLGVGTGVLGGFTTYSSFAVQTDLLVSDGRGWSAAAYVAASLVGGLLAVAAGVSVAARRRRWDESDVDVDPDIEDV